MSDDDEEVQEEPGEEPGEEEEVCDSPEEEVELWDGTVPEDVHPVGKELHRKISLVYGQNLAAGEPLWVDAEYGEAFESGECIRYGFDWKKHGLDVFARHSDQVTAQYTTGRSHKVEGILFGTGEKCGEWDTFTLFHPMPMSGTAITRLEVGQEVSIGPEDGSGDEGIVLRILRGRKAAGRSSDAKTQFCYLVLLLVEGNLRYAALPHVHGEYEFDPAQPSDANHPFIGDDWLSKPRVIEKALQKWVPKSTSAATKAAAQYVSTLYPSSDESDESDESDPPARRRKHRKCR